MKRKDSRLTISQIRALVRDSSRPISPSRFRALKRDRRIGVRRLLAGLDEAALFEKHEPYRLERIRRLEFVLWSRGIRLVAGVDECGIGPMAGPVIAGAVIFAPSTLIDGIDDSKRLDEETRSRLACTIRQEAVAFAIGQASVEEIDRINVYHAGLLAMRRAVKNLPRRPDFLLTDARSIPGESTPARPIRKGDSNSYSVAAASIIAKDHRDGLMRDLDRLFPHYGFASHKGYCTADHQETLTRFGPCVHHRMSFPVIAELTGKCSPPYYELRKWLARQVTLLDLSKFKSRLRSCREELTPGELRRLRALACRRRASIR